MAENKKKNTGLIILVVILVIALLGACGYIVYDKFFTKTDNNMEVLEKENNKDKVVRFDYDEATKLLKKFNLLDDSLNGYKGSVASNYSNTTLDSSAKLRIVIENIDSSDFKDVKCDDVFSGRGNGNFYQTDAGVCFVGKMTKSISYDKVNEVYNLMFDENAPKKGASYAGSNNYFFYGYSNETNSFVKTECNGCGGATGPSVSISEVKEANLDGNTLIIKAYYDLLPGSSDGKYKTGDFEFTSASYMTDNYQNVVREDVHDKYISNFPLYEIKFEKVNGNFVYRNMKKIA